MEKQVVAPDEVGFGYNNKVFSAIPAANIIYGSFTNSNFTSPSWYEKPDKSIKHFGIFVDDFFAILDSAVVCINSTRSPEPVSFIDIQANEEISRYWCYVPETDKNGLASTQEMMYLFTKTNRHGNQFVVVGKDPCLIDRLFPDETINAVDFILRPSSSVPFLPHPL